MNKQIKLTKDWRSQDLPAEIRAFLETWQSIADEEMKTYEFGWPAKYVITRFTFRGIRYIITPETFDIPDDLCECFQGGPWIVERHGRTMEDDLRAIQGVRNIFSDGFLD